MDSFKEDIEMDREEFKEEIVELETIQVAVNDKLHVIQEQFLKMKNLLDNVENRITELRKDVGKST